jgi:serine protease Do
MADKSRASLLITLSLLAVIGVALFKLPDVISTVTYAVDRGKSQAARERLADELPQLSDRFHDVALALQPSVVSISSVKKVSAGTQDRSTPMPQLPEEFREFFGDGLDRFFQFPAPRGGFVQRGLGSGVIVSDDGYILTNSHVVRDADEVTVILSDDRQSVAEVIGHDAATDLAVLKVNQTDLIPASLGDSNKEKVGRWVLAIGSPMGLDQTVTAGIISATGRANVGIADYEDFIQTDAAINPGNSGGPLVNLKGEVIGINTAIASRTGGNMGIGFAIPSNMASRIQQAIIEHGGVERGWFGAMIQNLTEDLAASFEFDSTDGVLLGDVVPEGPAAEAGLQAGDIVVKFDGKTIDNANELRNRVAETEPGTKAKMRVFRDGEYREVTVEIGRRDEDQAMPVGSAQPATSEDLGLTVQSLTPEIAAQLNLDANDEGAVITRVDPSGLAYRAGVRSGDLIVAVNNRPIANVSDFRAALNDNPPSDGIRLQLKREGFSRFVYIKSTE